MKFLKRLRCAVSDHHLREMARDGRSGLPVHLCERCGKVFDYGAPVSRLRQMYGLLCDIFGHSALVVLDHEPGTENTFEACPRCRKTWTCA
jgi:hypothetical protein